MVKNSTFEFFDSNFNDNAGLSSKVGNKESIIRIIFSSVFILCLFLAQYMYYKAFWQIYLIKTLNILSDASSTIYKKYMIK